MAIPDDNPAGVIDILTISQIGKVRDIKVSLDITHTWIGDLIVELSAPSGHGVILHQRSGGSQDNLIKTFGIEEIPALQSLFGEGVHGAFLALAKADPIIKHRLRMQCCKPKH